MKRKKGLFIVLEGLDGSGTTTQAKFLAEYLKKRSYKIELTSEPSNNIIGGLIRGILTRQWKITPVGLQLLFAADRAHHLENFVLPALKKKQVIISTRYFFSSLAFGSLDIDQKWLIEINKKFLIPDVTFFIDTNPAECLRRIAKTRIRKEFFEEKKKLEKVRKNYYQLVKKYPRFYKIDGNKKEKEVFETIKRIIDKFIKS
ncbi:MAG: dTMP kinase [Candidatus Moranbacteria bacterium RIFOXYB1_FULL_44_23]|nr:MAG: dTMP kinase [Candidatus Moranbacteria bacterium RIFOXYB1_FULL_44_23]OGI42803.1 MAG: dTMP kinase [Candidatus Moranbacteria bacterium RIFOXYD1_FULL_44_9]